VLIDSIPIDDPRSPEIRCAVFVVVETTLGVVAIDGGPGTPSLMISGVSIRQGGCDDLDWYFVVAPAFPCTVTTSSNLPCFGSWAKLIRSKL